MRKVYIIIVILVWMGMAIVMNFFPRPTYSELEKRELTRRPDITWEAFKSGDLTSGISSWYSDSEPYRDKLMEISMMFDKAIRWSFGEDNITFHASSNIPNISDYDDPESSDISYPDSISPDSWDIDTEGNEAEDVAKIADAGIIITGEGENLRALMAFGGGKNGGLAYASAANEYYDVFGDSVNIYCMAIPIAIEFYCPKKAKRLTNPQLPVINNIYSNLKEGVKEVDVYTVLSVHKNEDIYLRTDHHWTPLGAFYAARKFADVAGVPFRELDAYERKVVKGFVGSMYGYSGDISVKQSPEDFVYYVPNQVEYTTTFTDYITDKNYRVIGEGKPYKGAFFKHYNDGSGRAYSTFMGGDMKLTVVRTSTGNGRRLIILKDSYGNALPGYLFYSFEEIHVLDTRYFNKNIKKYVSENKITDILFANNIYNSYSPKYSKKYHNMLIRDDNQVIIPPKEEVKIDSVKVEEEKSDSVKVEEEVYEEPDSILTEM